MGKREGKRERERESERERERESIPSCGCILDFELWEPGIEGTCIPAYTHTHTYTYTHTHTHKAPTTAHMRRARERKHQHKITQYRVCVCVCEREREREKEREATHSLRTRDLEREGGEVAEGVGEAENRRHERRDTVDAGGNGGVWGLGVTTGWLAG